MKIEWEGRSWNYDERAVTVPMLRIIKKETGFLWPTEFGEAINRMDPDALAGLMWLVKTQNGAQVSLDDMDGSVLDFLEAFGRAAEAERAKEPADPQSPAVEGGTTGTSEISETSI